MKAGARTKPLKKEYLDKSTVFWGVKLNRNKQNKVLEQVKSWVENGDKGRWVATVNPEFMMKAVGDRRFMKLLESTDVNVVDGVGLVWAMEVTKGKTVGQRLKLGWNRGIRVISGKSRNSLVPGCELLEAMTVMAALEGYKVFFLGGWKDRAERTAKRFGQIYPRLRVAFSQGSPEETDGETIKKINEFEPDFLFVAYSMKKHMEWIEVNRNKLKAGVIMGVGRSFDYLSGDLKRAPFGWRKMGLEWLYSLLKEPKRIRRQMELPKFIGKVIWG